MFNIGKKKLIINLSFSIVNAKLFPSQQKDNSVK